MRIVFVGYDFVVKLEEKLFLYVINECLLK